MASSARNLEWMKSAMTIQTIGPDKINQLRHVRYYKDKAGLKAQMSKNSALLQKLIPLIIVQIMNAVSIVPVDSEILRRRFKRRKASHLQNRRT